LLPLDGLLPLGFYPYYSIAIALGSVAGNLFVFRSRGLPLDGKRRLLRVYLAAPPGILVVVRAMADAAAQAAAPFVPLYAVFIFAIFFLVPLLIRRSPR
jgi:hypothetical protein